MRALFGVGGSVIVLLGLALVVNQFVMIGFLVLGVGYCTLDVVFSE